jgi:hypothetical protein
MRPPALSIARVTVLLTFLQATLANAAPDLVVSATANVNNLTMDGAGSSTIRIVKVANLSLSTINAQGFTLSVTSGSLTKAGGSPIPFQVALVGDEVTAPTAAAFTVSSGGTLLHSTNIAGAQDVDLYIKYQSANLQDPGAYSASMNLNIIDN